MEKIRNFIIKKPLLSTIILTLLIQAVFHFDTWFLRTDLEQFINMPKVLSGTCNRIIATVLCILFMVYVLKGNLKDIGYNFKNTGRAFKYGFIILLIGLFTNCFSLFSLIVSNEGHFPQTAEEIFNVVGIIFECLLVAIYEETAYRCVLINTLRNKQITDERKKMFYCVIISSLLFGLVHVTNIISGEQPLLLGIGQIINAAGLGMMWGALYWISGSIMPPIIIHALWDAMSFTEYFYIIESTASTVSSSNQIGAVIYVIILSIPYILIALLILSKKKFKGDQIKLIPLVKQDNK